MEDEKIEKLKELIREARELENKFAELINEDTKIYISRISVEDGIEVLIQPSELHLDSEKQEIFTVINWKTRKATLGIGKVKFDF